MKNVAIHNGTIVRVLGRKCDNHGRCMCVAGKTCINAVGVVAQPEYGTSYSKFLRVKFGKSFVGCDFKRSEIAVENRRNYLLLMWWTKGPEVRGLYSGLAGMMRAGLRVKRGRRVPDMFSLEMGMGGAISVKPLE